MREAVADMLQDTPTEVPEEAPSDEEEEFKHLYRQNLTKEEGPVGKDISFVWEDPSEQAFTTTCVEEFHYKVRKVLKFVWAEATSSWVEQLEAETAEEPEQSNLSALEEKGNLKCRVAQNVTE